MSAILRKKGPFSMKIFTLKKIKKKGGLFSQNSIFQKQATFKVNLYSVKVSVL